MLNLTLLYQYTINAIQCLQVIPGQYFAQTIHKDSKGRPVKVSYKNSDGLLFLRTTLTDEKNGQYTKLFIDHYLGENFLKREIHHITYNSNGVIQSRKRIR